MPPGPVRRVSFFVPLLAGLAGGVDAALPDFGASGSAVDEGEGRSTTGSGGGGRTTVLVSRAAAVALATASVSIFAAAARLATTATTMTNITSSPKAAAAAAIHRGSAVFLFATGVTFGVIGVTPSAVGGPATAIIVGIVPIGSATRAPTTFREEAARGARRISSIAIERS